MANAKINVTNRTEGKNPRQIRAMGFIPGSIYGKGFEAQSVQLNTHDFELAYKANKEGNWDLDFNGKTITAKIQELQVNYATNEILNVEFATV